MLPTEQQKRQCDDYTKSGQYYPMPMIRIRNQYEIDKPAQDTHPEHYTDCRKDFKSVAPISQYLFLLCLQETFEVTNTCGTHVSHVSHAQTVTIIFNYLNN